MTDSPAPAPLRLGHTIGTSPGKWLRVWAERFPRRRIELVALPEDAGVDALVEERLDAALLRHPADQEKPDRSRRVTLYRESIALVVSIEHPLAEQDGLTMPELVGEPRAISSGSVTEVRAVAGNADDGSIDTPALLALVATGAVVGITTHPLARASSRKDVAVHVLADADGPAVSLFWPDGEDAVIQELLGVMRGRKAASSRGELAGDSTSSTGTGRAEEESRAGRDRNGDRRAASPRGGQAARRDRGSQGGKPGSRRRGRR
ncbi:LysR substrate-binding domain-containing protein [Mycetocola reblochoni]|uniref:LysR substrate-binding domain-containing protein n=1 Tax=Mycetocola reblochoni TaxID=331618 RepID=UPI0015C63602|nr:LysR substrate-binding domain-containing protein [Mycetocola reblochoni]